MNSLRRPEGHAPPTTSARGLLRQLREERGQSLVEFLLVLPMLVLLVFGIIEMGAAWRAYQVVTNSAREGARIAVVANGATYQEVIDATRERLRQGGLDPDRSTITITCDDGVDGDCIPGSTGNSTEVGIEYPHTFILLGPIARYMGGDGSAYGTVTMQTGIVMRNE